VVTNLLFESFCTIVILLASICRRSRPSPLGPSLATFSVFVGVDLLSTGRT
jgi:hypothetical protein